MLSNDEIRGMKLNPGQTKKEIKRLQEELPRLQKVGWRTQEGEILEQLGDIHCYVLGNAEEGRKFYKKKLKIARKNKNRAGEMNCLGIMGRVYLEYASGPKWLQKALHCNEQALKIAQELGDQKSECNYSGAVIAANLALGNHEKVSEFSLNSDYGKGSQEPICEVHYP